MGITNRILELLSRDAPLSPTKIAEILNLKIKSVTAALTFLRKFGFVQYHRGMRGFYELTEEGRKIVKLTEEETSD